MDKEKEEEKKIGILSNRFLWSEGRVLRDRPPQRDKRNWLKSQCTHCGYKIQYIPTEEWRGRLRCPDCGKFFNVPTENESGLIGPTLDDFSKEKWKITHCPYCQRRVEYSPKKDWDRKLLCPHNHCGRVFELPSLDGFMGEVG